MYYSAVVYLIIIANICSLLLNIYEFMKHENISCMRMLILYDKFYVFNLDLC